jgi:choline dehydrogenase-like flavoprotein
MDPNFFATEPDRALMRHGILQVMRTLLETPEGQNIVKSEVFPSDCSKLTLESTDDEIDSSVVRTGSSFYHTADSLAMGKLVDTELRVKRVQNLRVVDASVLPVFIAAHFQLCIYAFAEQSADIILAARHLIKTRLAFCFIKYFLRIKLLTSNERIIISISWYCWP